MNAQSLAALHCAVFAKGWDAVSIAGMLAVPGTFAVEDAGQGMIMLRVAHEQADLLTLAVLPAFRRQGVAGRLLKGAMATAARMGAEALLLEVGEDNTAARKLYQKYGFTEISRRRDYYGAGKDAIVMRSALTVEAASLS